MSVSPDDVRTGRNMYGAYAVADDIYVPQVTDELVIKACGEYHLTFYPSVLPAASWRKIMVTLADHFGEDASLEAGTRDKVRAYLIANSEKSAADQADPPLRFTNLNWFLQGHGEGDVEGMIYEHKVRTMADCIACHRNAERGHFELR